MNSEALRRALVIGLAGPAVQAAGIVIEAGHILLSHLHQPLSARHILFEPGFLIIFVGFLVSLVCIPLAIEVARSKDDELEIPLFGVTRSQAQQALEAQD